MLFCGLAEVDITPPFGSSIPGYTEERKGTAIKNPLYAKSFVVQSGQTTLVFVAIDALFVPVREANRIRDRLKEHAGIQPEQVIISATHTHTGPPVRRGLDGSGNDEYMAELVNRASAAAIAAYDNRKPAVIGWGAGRNSDISFNRRYWMKDGKLRTNPGYMNPDIDHPAGPIDPSVSVIRIDHLDGTAMGVITNFACHTDTVGGTEYSGDYPAVLSEALKRSLGEQVVSVFSLGACGDINHCNFSKLRQASPNITEWMGQQLAEEVLQVRENIVTRGQAEAAAVRSFIGMELREASEEEVAHAQQVLNDSSIKGAERFFAEQIMKVKEVPGGSAQLEIQAVRLGDLAFVGFPGEIFVELGLAVKQASPFSDTWVGTLCNGSIYGYVCTAAAYTQGGYEPRLKLFNRIAPGTGERMVDTAVDLLQRLFQKES